jgi:hypothetical protein
MQKVIVIKVNGKKIRKKEKENIFLNLDKFMMDNLKKIYMKGLEN